MFKIRIRTQIIGGFSLISLLILLLSIYSVLSTRATLLDLKNLKNEIVVQTMSFIELDRDIIQIQQWLTDVSATRAMEGFDDGFGEAEKYYKDAMGILDEMLRDGSIKPEELGELQKLKSEIKAFYDVGRQMADVYVKQGPEAGNEFMGKFDPYAEALGETIGTIVKRHDDELHFVLQDITNMSASIMRMSAFLSIVALVLAVTLSVVVTRSVLRPLHEFKGKFEQGASGDLTVQIGYSKENEIGELSASFNSFTRSLRSLIEMLKNTIGEIKENSTTLSSASEEFSVTFNQQSSEISNIAGAMDTLAGSTMDIISRLENMTEMVESTSLETAEAFTHLKDVISKTEEISEDTNKLSGVMESLVDSSSEIENILKVINDIAEQTNLLALNAAIEAARAGDAGRGFAVVADEVRKLAERTQTATGEVETIVTQLMKDTSRAKDSMEVSVEKVGEGMSLIRNLETFYRKVSDNMQNINSEQSVISSSMSASAGNIEEVNHSLQGISASIQEASQAIGQIAGAATGLQSNAANLSQKSETFKI
jgi:methyl-accepting chemotaxis protein